jgi:F-type H+-transporting ATPase subunit epsilon
MKFELVSLDGVKFSEDAYSVVLPTLAGQITVLVGHEPLLSALKPGIVTIRRHKTDADYHLEHYAVYGGVVEIGSKRTRVLVDEATHGDEVSEAEAQKAHVAAVKMREQAKTQMDIEHATTEIDRQAVRLDLAKIRRHTKRHQ